MQKMLLRREIFGKVPTGEKTSTSRRGIRDIVPGPLEFAMTEDENTTIVVNVTDVVVTPYSELSLKEAKLEGYETKEELQNVLSHIYKDIKSDEPFTFIKFELISD